MPKVQQGVNDLYTWCLNNGRYGEQLIQEWTGMDEHNQQISMDNITYGSAKRVLWICREGHEWVTRIYDRTRSKSAGCPHCSVQRGINDLYTWCLRNGERGQQLLNEWVDLDENSDPISIYDVSYGSSKRVQWMCSNGHIWTEAVGKRTHGKQDCPYCKEQYKEKQYYQNLKNIKRPRNKESIRLGTWCSTHGALGAQLRAEWVGLDENNKPISMSEIAVSSNHRVMWRCEKGHIWLEGVIDRIHRTSKCPFCSVERNKAEKQQKIGKQQKQVKPMSLLDWCLRRGAYGKQLMDEWNYRTPDNRPFGMEKESFESKTVVFWRCKNGHCWSKAKQH